VERLSSLDAVFLAIEDPRNQMSIGTVAIFDGPAPSLPAVCELLATRIPLVPRCRQRVREPSGPFGRPVWIDDVGFDLRDHIHPLSLTGSGPRELDDVVTELMSPPLDRHRALWDVWLVDGVDDGRWAIVAKVHHCMVDGIAGSDLLGAILDRELDAGSTAPDTWTPSPEPSELAFAWYGVTTAMRSLLARARSVVAVLGQPRRSWTHAVDVAAAAKRLWYRQHHAPTSLTGPIGTQRRWAHTAVSFTDISAIRAALGGTVNDVVVAAVSSGFRDLLVERGESVDHRTITAMVPVSLRGPARHGETGNRVANVHALLPVGHTDPRSTLKAVHDQIEELKGSHEIEATGLLLSIGDFVPRVIADRIARAILHRQRSVETVITNVPGPRSALHLGSHRMIAGYPVAPIGGQVRITVAIWSYVDHLYVGITGDRDTTADIGHLERGIARGFADLLGAARTS
jgi:diacylglycerol O-acyltransferase